MWEQVETLKHKSDIRKKIMFSTDHNIMRHSTLMCLHLQNYRYLKSSEIFPFLIFSILLTTRNKSLHLFPEQALFATFSINRYIPDYFYNTLQGVE